jgi:hypothetical protein
VKWLVGLIDIPFMYLNRWVMNRRTSSSWTNDGRGFP